MYQMQKHGELSSTLCSTLIDVVAELSQPQVTLQLRHVVHLMVVMFINWNLSALMTPKGCFSKEHLVLQIYHILIWREFWMIY
jgi:hypothetical protein